MKNFPNEKDAVSYRAQGWIVFRQAVPASLIADLRRSAGQARELARRLDGPQTQRLQTVGRHAEVDAGPLKDFTELPELNAALQALLSPRHYLSPPAAMAFLFEPAERCWATEWHRDWRDHMSAAQFEGVFAGDWEATATDLNLFNQINCALYEDTSTWYVPGTHARLQDTPAEVAAAKAADRAAVENTAGTRSEAAQEVFLRDYCEGMPGAVQLTLQAGDIALYRSIGWHIGSYVPYRKRATLHCSAVTPEYLAFWKHSEAVLSKKWM